MLLLIEIPDSTIPEQQKNIDIPVHFIDKDVCDVGGYHFSTIPESEVKKLNLQEQEYSALDKIRAEVDVQEKWLTQDVGYSAYYTECAFDAIRLTIDILKKEMEEK